MVCGSGGGDRRKGTGLRRRVWWIVVVVACSVDEDDDDDDVLPTSKGVSGQRGRGAATDRRAHPNLSRAPANRRWYSNRAPERASSAEDLSSLKGNNTRQAEKCKYGGQQLRLARAETRGGRARCSAQRKRLPTKRQIWDSAKSISPEWTPRGGHQERRRAVSARADAPTAAWRWPIPLAAPRARPHRGSDRRNALEPATVPPGSASAMTVARSSRESCSDHHCVEKKTTITARLERWPYKEQQALTSDTESPMIVVFLSLVSISSLLTDLWNINKFC